MNVPLRVVARVQPPSEGEDCCIHVVPSASQILIGSDDNFFHFDAVFSEETSQKELFSTCLDDIVTSFYHGLNATVLSYGQQGSGKTYTMVGPDFPWAMNEDQFGLLPRAVRHIFRLMDDFPGREYRICVSYLVIHHESVYDLLSSGSQLTPLNVLEDNMGNVVIPGRAVINCNNINDVLCCLMEGLAQKHSASSRGFDLSSSHSIFTFTLEHQWLEADSKLKYLYSRLDFVDLAGADETTFSYNNTTSPEKEFLLPNSDMKALRNIIHCLANKNNENSVPYKDSRLTHVLKDALGGNSRTLMICCLSPSTKDMEESFRTSKIGCLARYIINFPVMNLVVQNSLQSNSTANSALNIQLSSQSSTQTTNLSSVGISQRTLNNQFLPQLVPQPPNPAPRIGPHAINRVCDENSNIEEDEIFRVHFAASQWHLLVSSAEDLLGEILRSGCVSPTAKSRIQSWICMKAEADDCIGNDVPPLLAPQGGAQRPLDVIEELSEPNELSESSMDSAGSEISSESSIGEEFYQDLEVLKQSFFDLTNELIKTTEKNYTKKEKDCSSNEADSSNLPMQLDPADQILQKDDKMSISSEENFSSKINFFDEKENIEPEVECSSSKAGLLSDAHPFQSVRKEMKYRLSGRKRPPKPRIKSSKGKLSYFSFEGSSTESTKGSLRDSPSPKDVDSETEILRKVSSKLLSVSKGSSKCVDSLRSKSSQLKRSIKSHIFKKRNKYTQEPPGEGIELTRLNESLEGGRRPCAPRRLSLELKEAKDKLKDLNATINAKESLLTEMRRGGQAAEATRQKCKLKIQNLEEDIHYVDKLYIKAQSKLMEVSDDEEKIHYRKKVDTFHRQMKQLQKRISYLQKVSAIAGSSKLNVGELKESLASLREEQEELLTKVREETQRKEQLERSIFTNERCSRKPPDRETFDDDTDMDDILEEDEVKEDDLQVPPPHPPSHSLKRKLASSTGDSQGKNGSSVEGSCNNRRFPHSKAGRLDTDEEERGELLRGEVAQLRETKESLQIKIQKLNKRIRKVGVNREGGSSGCEEEKRLMELDETVEGIDWIIEHKNQVLCGGANKLEDVASFLHKYDLIGKVRYLTLEELQLLLVKYFDRVIDLRIEFRKQELEFTNLEAHYDEQNRYIFRLKAACQKASAEMERRLTTLHREYYHNITTLYRNFNKDSTGYKSLELRLLDLEQQLLYYKKRNQELKDRLRLHYSSGGGGDRRYSEALPGPSGIRRHSPAPAILPGDLEGSSNPLFTRRGRRFAVDERSETKITRGKNKIIIQKKDGR